EIEIFDRKEKVNINYITEKVRNNSYLEPEEIRSIKEMKKEYDRKKNSKWNCVFSKLEEKYVLKGKEKSYFSKK
ncbi:unnamed protein product, partial [Larinioides sclopetarius]